MPIVKSEEKSVLKYVNTISVKPQNVWMVTHRVISLKNVSQIQIQSSNQTSTFKIITKPSKKNLSGRRQLSHVSTEHGMPWINGRSSVEMPASPMENKAPV